MERIEFVTLGTEWIDGDVGVAVAELHTFGCDCCSERIRTRDEALVGEAIDQIIARLERQLSRARLCKTIICTEGVDGLMAAFMTGEIPA